MLTWQFTSARIFPRCVPYTTLLTSSGYGTCMRKHASSDCQQRNFELQSADFVWSHEPLCHSISACCHIINSNSLFVLSRNHKQMLTHPEPGTQARTI